MRRPPLLAALVAGALVSAGCGVDDPYQGANTTATTSTSPVATVDTPRATSTTPPDQASDDHAALSPAQRDAQRRAERAARSFLRTYLPYSYAQHSAATIRRATPALRRELARNPPRVDPNLSRDARPRVLRLRSSGLTRTRVYFLAQVDDGESTYATTLTVALRDNRWLVSEVK